MISGRRSSSGKVYHRSLPERPCGDRCGHDSGIVEMIDLAHLTSPIPGEDPCGRDLDAEGDADYLNFCASVEAVFPASFFEVRDEEGNVRRFDPKALRP